jgi:ribosomal protein S18 acetylase RimI-like enzyme
MYQGVDYMVELARPGDGEAICRVIAETWLDTYPNESHGITADMIYPRQYDPDGQLSREKIALTEDSIADEDEGRAIFVARKNDEVVGVSSTSITDNGEQKLNVLFVLPSTQGMGIGVSLYNAAIDRLRSGDIYLKVVSYNQRALAMYTRRGFEVTQPVSGDDRLIFENGVVLPELEMVKRA